MTDSVVLGPPTTGYDISVVQFYSLMTSSQRGLMEKKIF